MTEVWKPIPSAPGYEASNMGQVRSLDRVVLVAATNSDIMQRSAHIKRRKGRVLSFRISRYVYAQVAGRTCLVHRLVAEAFIGPCPDGHIVCHGPGGPLDNRLENISYGTHAKNNGEDKRRDGTVSRGERNSLSRLAKDQVVEVKRRILAGEGPTSISRSFGVAPATIRDIAVGRTWGWLEVPA